MPVRSVGIDLLEMMLHAWNVRFTLDLVSSAARIADTSSPENRKQ